MKTNILHLALIHFALQYFTTTVSAQNIPNGGFEEVVIDTSFPLQSYPVNWMPFHWVSAQIECWPYLEQQGKLSHDSHTGEFAVKMETQACETVNGWEQRPGGYTIGKAGVWPPYDRAVAHNHRPEELNFFYKFHQESSDSAFVSVTLFNYDSLTPNIPWTQRYDTIGFGFSYIVEPTETYMAYTLPITYFSDSVPGFINIVFGSGYKCTLNNCTPGTILWVDDVSVSGGSLGIADRKRAKPQVSVFPNPSTHSFRIQSKDPIQITKVSMLDGLGKELKVWNNFEDEFSIAGHPVGIYLIRIETSQGIAVEKLMKVN